jgi:hypothetical protein
MNCRETKPKALHGCDEGLGYAAFYVFRKTPKIAPHCRQSAGERRQTANHSTRETNRSIGNRATNVLEGHRRRPKQHVGRIRGKKDTETHAEAVCINRPECVQPERYAR